MTTSDVQVSAAPMGPAPPATRRGPVLGSWWVIAGATLLMLAALGWRFAQNGRKHVAESA